MKFRQGEEVTFVADTGRKFQAVVTEPRIQSGKIAIQLLSDPFPVRVKVAQITKKETHMPPVSKAKKLRQDAQALGIKGSGEMGLKELERAVAAAKNPKPAAAKPAPAKVAAKSTPAKAAQKPAKAKSKPKTAPAAKKAAAKPQKAAQAPKKATKAPTAKAVQSGSTDNPFRSGSNLHRMTEELLRGGKRTDMIKRLMKSMRINPWSKDKEENPEKAIDKRLLITAGTLKKDYGFTIQMEGRGNSGTLKAIPPGSAKSNGKASTSTSTSTKKTLAKKGSGKASTKKASSNATSRKSATKK